MDLTAPFELTRATLLGWCLQLALIAWVSAPGGGPIRLPRSPLSLGLVAIAAGWVWRLAYSFALAAGGFRFWVGDDAVRWLRAWQWSQEPFFVLPGDPWLPGPYVLLGSAMALLGDPMVATRLLASLLCVLPLVGAFLLSLALFRSVSLGICAVALLTPQWLHLLLGTGAMSELPVTGLVSIGLALQLLGVRGLRDAALGGDGAGSRRLSWLGAACLALATTQHLVAWFLVAVVQGGLLLVALHRGGPMGARLRRWAGPALLSVSFCLVWLVALQLVTGSAFSQLELARETRIFRYGRPGDWIGNLRIHPAALLYTVWSLAPLVLFGWLRPLLPHPPGGTPARGLALGIGAVLLLFMATSGSGTNVTPFRTVLPLTAGLLPLVAGAVFAEGGAPGRRVAARGVLAIALAAGILLGFVRSQHQNVFARQRLADVAWTRPRAVLPESLELSDTRALGTWMRREFMGYGVLDDESLAQPIRVFVAADHPYHWFEWLFLQHALGAPGRLASAQRTFQDVPDLGAEVRALLPRQLLVSNGEVHDPRVVERFRVGRYVVYEGRAGTAP